jgi:ribosomal protein S18 acetylase RimI-like enzyme
MTTIVSTTEAHKEPIRKLLFETGFFRDDEVSVAIELIEAYLAKMDDYELYTALDEQGVVQGYVCFGLTPMTLSTYDLYWIAVSPTAQGKGVGKKLLTFTAALLQKRNAKLILIETSSQPKYEPTRKFYDKSGCTLEAVIKDFYREGDDKLIYTIRL